MLYYDTPTQVMFLMNDNDTSAGIAYQDYIICGCCGSIIPLDEIDEILEELPWVSLRDEIIGN